MLFILIGRMIVGGLVIVKARCGMSLRGNLPKHLGRPSLGDGHQPLERMF